MELRVLGHFELVSDAGEAIPITRPLVRGAIFALVLYRNRSVSPERLIDLLWGTSPDTHRLHSLRTCMWGARKLLPPECLITDDVGHRLRIDRDHDRVDLDRFRDLQRQGRAALRTGDTIGAVRLLEEAMQVWGSGRLADLLPATSAMTSLVTGLIEEHRDARNALVQARLALGQHRELLPELRALIAGEPDNERLWGQLMLVLYRCGLKTEALKVFTEARTALMAHAGARPGAELQALRRQIRADDPALVPDPVPTAPAAHEVRRDASPHQLPSDLVDFTGRDSETEELISLLSAPVEATAAPVVEVTGPPGVGKTALAVHVAHTLAHRYPDGQLYIGLAGLSPTPTSASAALWEALQTLGTSSGDIADATQQRAAAYRSRLAGRKMLIILDEAASPEQVRPLLPGTAGCALILTSRTRLAGLVPDHSIRLEPMEHRDALHLLIRIIGQRRATAAPDAAGLIVDACGGFPLAVRIAGQRLAARPHRPIADLARTLSDDSRRLDELVNGDQAVRASIAPSYRALEPAAARAFRLLALAGENRIARWVADVLLGEPSTDVVDTLVDHSMLAAAACDANEQPCYRLYDLLREYGAELLAIDPEAETARERLAHARAELAAIADTARPRRPHRPPSGAA